MEETLSRQKKSRSGAFTAQEACKFKASMEDLVKLCLKIKVSSLAYILVWAFTLAYQVPGRKFPSHYCQKINK